MCVRQFHFARRWGETESARTRKLQDPATAQLKTLHDYCQGLHVCLYVCMHSFMCVSLYLDICRYACMYIFMCVFVYVTSIKNRENFWQALSLFPAPDKNNVTFSLSVVFYCKFTMHPGVTHQ